ncbi:hypothetical protein OIU77_024256 [Salix suchowensis]|uniref:Growth-regulating factor n=1 Tax=Salix suchowensis TaxID=1278906 RepID=A0ABQ9BU85_9ROSI|nr:hypothetical protein OIU77_024256 [Salix suchowensis]
MESEYFFNAGVPPQALLFEQTSTSSSMPIWQSHSSPMEMQDNCSAHRLLNSTWEKSTGHGPHLESTLSSMVSSPGVANCNVSGESFIFRELIGKLGNIGNSNNPGEISPHSQPMLAASYFTAANNSANTSCYTTPLSSPPKLSMPAMDQFSKEHLNIPSLGKPMGFEFQCGRIHSRSWICRESCKVLLLWQQKFQWKNQPVGAKQC